MATKLLSRTHPRTAPPKRAPALPVNAAPTIDGFHAIEGIVRTCYDGVLSAVPGTTPAPFEIILESPQLAPIALQCAATVLALGEITRHSRRRISYAANL
jgi:hypothetical protein